MLTKRIYIYYASDDDWNLVSRNALELFCYLITEKIQLTEKYKIPW